MTDHNDPSFTGVVDPSILNVDADTGIPTFLRRHEEHHAQHAPVFTTQVDEQGQTELTVEEQQYAAEDPEADMPVHEGEQVLAALPDQPDVQTAVSQEAIEEVVTSAGNEALVSNAPSEMEKANEEELPPTNHNQPADPAEMRRDFFKDINKFGKASGEGASALGRLGLRALRAAADGVISTAKPQGGGKDDATLIYEAYTAMDSKHAEHTAGGAKANASKLRQIIGMGCMTTLSDPVAVGDRVVRIHDQMSEADLKPKAIFAALVDVAREQQASDSELTDDAIRACLTKTKADKTLEKEWEAIAKKVEGLVTGENSHGLKDQSEAAIKIQELVTEHIKNYKLDGTRQDRIDSMIDLGYSRAQAEAIVDKKIAV